MKEKNNVDLRLVARIVIAALLLIGIGLLITLISGGDVAGMFSGLTTDEPGYQSVIYLLVAVSIVLIAVGVCGLVILHRKAPVQEQSRSSWTVKQLVTGALCIGLAFILSYIRIYKMPNGGSITPASMLPIMLFAYIYGTPKGIIVGVAYGLLQMIQDPWIVSLPQVLLDYVFAFGALSLAGLFRRNIVPGIIVAALGRFLFAFLSGIIFFAEYAPEGMSPAVYSLGYQASYILPEAAICIVIVLIPAIRKNIELLRAQADERRKPALA